MGNDGNNYKDLLKSPFKLVGAKQAEKGVVKGGVRCVIVAFDAGEHIRSRFAALCKEYGAEFFDGPSMKELGSLCGIEVGASVTGILKE
ncbi:MAG: ribosomal L7Ae/L30e/S12e/Gadd45 family protein [Clostridiales bacterium]|jgi:large subunit ribosomal protein L7A|nr:ribosomal L7Ae/L30e/S12e/Gadd45 family protein [Clostridiales bacterium]